ncbi:hypothetical protein AB0J86_30600 [Micromonospora sp. NPDC049559]|uniref:hypothetical protein n=1 Tax=Micromonospora sp. NPDC049559 TaxID=3155923 RepID=UPI0034298AE3
MTEQNVPPRRPAELPRLDDESDEGGGDDEARLGRRRTLIALGVAAVAGAGAFAVTPPGRDLAGRLFGDYVHRADRHPQYQLR